MRRVSATVFLIVVTFVLVACAPPIDKAKARFCQDLGAYGEAVIALRQVDEKTTVDELQSVVNAAVDAYGRLFRSAEDLRLSQIDALQEANRNLVKAAEGVSGQSTLGEAEETVQRAMADTMAAYVDIANDVCTYGGQ
jgi:hypothetical protein